MQLSYAEKAAVDAARQVGALMRRHLHAHKTANSVTQHDIKLQLDVRSQKLIEKKLRAALPEASVLGEEGSLASLAHERAAARQRKMGKRAANPTSPNSDEWRWVVDPIDGTVNFAYTIPHACVSIALQQKVIKRDKSTYPDGYRTVVGVVYDPFSNELWTAMDGQPARLNGRAIRVSNRRSLDQSIISIGFSKTAENLDATLPYFIELVHQVRKLRIMGSAALALTYVATGRFDGYIERGIRIWDIAAAGLIVERAGGHFHCEPIPGEHAYRMLASNQPLRRKLRIPG